MRLLLSGSAAALVLLGSLTANAQPAAPAAPTVATVGANLNISPKRVTLDRNRRSATVYIYNQGNTPGTFDIAMVDRAMLPDGQIVAATDAAGKRPEAAAAIAQLSSAQNMLVISPRRATLAPGKGQTIRIQLRNLPEQASAAEYRTHLTVTTIPPANAGLTAEQAAGIGANELRFQINSVFGISIPAIVRGGPPDVRAGIEKAHVEFADVSLDGTSPPRRTAFAVFDLVRQGPNSLFGNIDVRSVGRKSESVGLARGLGVYPEISKRTVRVPLSRAPAAGEKLEITFTDDDTSPGKLLAKQVL